MGAGKGTNHDPVAIGVTPERQGYLMFVARPATDCVQQDVVHPCHAPDSIVVSHFETGDMTLGDLDDLIVGGRLPLHFDPLTCSLVLVHGATVAGHPSRPRFGRRTPGPR